MNSPHDENADPPHADPPTRLSPGPPTRLPPSPLAWIIAASARNPVLVILLTILAVAAGLNALYQTPLDAIPDLSEVQVTVYTDWQGRSPDLIEDQITYPITAKFISAPKVKVVQIGRAHV